MALAATVATALAPSLTWNAVTGRRNRTDPTSPFALLGAGPAWRSARSRAEPVINGAVAVIVYSVADLVGSGKSRLLIVVAVSAAGRYAISVDVESLVDDEVTVLIATVTDLDGAGIDTCITVIAIALGDGYTIAVVICSARYADS